METLGTSGAHYLLLQLGPVMVNPACFMGWNGCHQRSSVSLPCHCGLFHSLSNEKEQKWHFCYSLVLHVLNVLLCMRALSELSLYNGDYCFEERSFLVCKICIVICLSTVIFFSLLSLFHGTF